MATILNTIAHTITNLYTQSPPPPQHPHINPLTSHAVPVAGRHLQDALGSQRGHQAGLVPVTCVAQPCEGKGEEKGRKETMDKYKRIRQINKATYTKFYYKKIQPKTKLNTITTNNKQTNHRHNIKYLYHSPSFPPDPLPQAQTPALPEASVWSVPQLICLIGSSERSATGTGK